MKFKTLIKKNRKKLREAGYAPSTINSWENGQYPKIETAIIIADLLGVSINEVPYFKIVRKSP